MDTEKEQEKEIYTNAWNKFKEQKDGSLFSLTRYQKVNEREYRSDHDNACLLNLHKGKYKIVSRGIPMMKHSLDIIIQEQLLWELKPQTIFEFGCYSGASALWLSDTMKRYEVETHLYTLDLDTSLVSPLAKNNKNITVIEDDVANVAKIFPEEMLKNLPHPWFISEDCHFHVMKTLEHFHKFMQQGDYIVVDDTNPNCPTFTDDGYVLEGKWGRAKLDIVHEFLKKHEDYYRIDSYYVDMFGYNGTMNWDGFIKRIK